MRIFGFSKFSSLEITITISKSCFPKDFSAELPNYQGHPIGNRNISFLRKLVALTILLLNQRRVIFMKSRKLGFFSFCSFIIREPTHSFRFFQLFKRNFHFVRSRNVSTFYISFVSFLTKQQHRSRTILFVYSQKQCQSLDKTAIELREFKLLIKDYFFSAVKSFKQERTFPSNNIHHFILRRVC